MPGRLLKIAASLAPFLGLSMLPACASSDGSRLAGPGPSCPPNQVVVCAGNSGSRSTEAADRELRYCECKRVEHIDF